MYKDIHHWVPKPAGKKILELQKNWNYGNLSLKCNLSLLYLIPLSLLNEVQQIISHSIQQSLSFSPMKRFFPKKYLELERENRKRG